MEIASDVIRNIVLSKDDISKDNISSNSTERDNPKEERKELEDVSSNLNGIADDDDEIDNPKFYIST